MPRLPHIIATIIAALGLQACHTLDGPEMPNLRSPLALKAPYRLGDGTMLPAGTVLTDQTDANGRPFIHFRLPEGYGLVTDGMDAGASAAELAMEGGITCNCTQGTGCSPFKAESSTGTVVIGCSMSRGCTECTQTATSLVQGTNGVVVDPRREAEVLHLAAGISFVLGREELDSLSCPGAVTLRWSGFTRSVADFLAGMQVADREAVRSATRREELPAGYVMMAINAYGKAMRVPVQRGLTISEQVAGAFGASSQGAAVAAAEADLAKTTCRCVSGEAGCTYERKSMPLVGYAEWCEAGSCKTCQMNW